MKDLEILPHRILLVDAPLRWLSSAPQRARHAVPLLAGAGRRAIRAKSELV